MILIGRGLDFKDLEIKNSERERARSAQNGQNLNQGCAVVRMRKASRGLLKRKKSKTEGADRSQQGNGIAGKEDPMVRNERRLNSSPFPVAMTKGFHLYPYRTQKLSPSVPMVLDW